MENGKNKLNYSEIELIITALKDRADSEEAYGTEATNPLPPLIMRRQPNAIELSQSSRHSNFECRNARLSGVRVGWPQRADDGRPKR